MHKLAAFTWHQRPKAQLQVFRRLLSVSGQRRLFQSIRPFQPHSSTPLYSSVTDRRLKMGRRRPSKLGDSAPLEEELSEQEEA